MRIPYTRWGGAAAAGVLADYADVKMKPVSSQLTNSELVAGILLAMDAFGIGGPDGSRNGTLVDAGADYGVGLLAAGIARRHMLPPAPVVTTAPATTTTTTHTTTTSSANGVTGVPASSGSAAFDLPMGGY